MQLKRELELLAPARNIDIGIAAIDCGADAVYIAGPAFGARQAAGNSVEDVGRLCDYAHRYGARIFVTLNTILYDDEVERAYEMLEALAGVGVDAVITQDLAVSPAGIALAGRAVEGLLFHASTQCAIRTPEEARFYEALGFSRLVLERELSLEQVWAIRAAVKCELEFFVHGALCVCYSGQCYLSEAIAGRSANRGSCIQACRSRYDVLDAAGRKIVSNKSVLSLKDFNLKHRLEALADAGVTSFKIEGRLKNLSYVKNIVRDYSLALDEIISRRPDEFRRASFGRIHGGFVPQADKTFNRGYTSLVIDGQRGDWASLDAAKSMGEEVGTVSRVFGASGQKRGLERAGGRIVAGDAGRKTMAGRIADGGFVFEIVPKHKGIVLNNGDGLCFVGNDGQVYGFRADVCSGFSVSCKPVRELRAGMTVFRNIDAAFEREIEGATGVRLLDVRTSVRGRIVPALGPGDGAVVLAGGTVGEEIELYLKAVSEDGRTAELSRKFPLSAKAENMERMREIFQAQLSKTTDIYRFTLCSIEGVVLPHLPVGGVNSLRRELAEILSAAECIRIPLYAAVASELPHIEATSYKQNISNAVSAALYREMGAAEIEPAFELAHTPGAELMRTKYCLKYQLGICPVHSKNGVRGPLTLLNQGRRLRLDFDCKACEMIVLAL